MDLYMSTLYYTLPCIEGSLIKCNKDTVHSLFSTYKFFACSLLFAYLILFYLVIQSYYCMLPVRILISGNSKQRPEA